MASQPTDQVLKEILETMKNLQLNQTQLSSIVDSINGRVNVLAGIKELEVPTPKDTHAHKATIPASTTSSQSTTLEPSPEAVEISSSNATKHGYTSRIILR
jgi:hypothetical protein